MTNRMTGPDCVVMGYLIYIHTHTHICSLSPSWRHSQPRSVRVAGMLNPVRGKLSRLFFSRLTKRYYYWSLSSMAQPTASSCYPQHDKSHCCEPLSYGRTLCRQSAAGVCNRDRGSMVELAEILMRPRGSAIVTRVPWFDGRQVKKFGEFCV